MKDEKLNEVPRVISNKEDLVIFSDTAYKAKEGNSTFGYIMMLNGIIVDTGVIQIAEARAVLAVVERARRNNFGRAHVLLDTK